MVHQFLILLSLLCLINMQVSNGLIPSHNWSIIRDNIWIFHETRMVLHQNGNANYTKRKIGIVTAYWNLFNSNNIFWHVCVTNFSNRPQMELHLFNLILDPCWDSNILVFNNDIFNHWCALKLIALMCPVLC